MRVFSRLLIFFLAISTCYPQSEQGILIDRMRQHEHNILNAYLEYQKLYYEDKSRGHELKAFEDLLTVYINQVMEIYETLNMSEKRNEIPRDIAARALVFKNLMFLEKAPLNPEYYEKACYEYYEALGLYEGTNSLPAIYKDLPQTIQTGDRTYFRLIDLLEDKGYELHNFGKVRISFRNFMVTANFDPEMLELIKIQDENGMFDRFTYELAEARIKMSFDEVFRRAREVETYVALPYGTYILRLNSGVKSNHTALTRFYVRQNQEQHYMMEPLADWIILYENPRSKRPDYYKFRRNQQKSDSLATNVAMTNGHSNGSGKSKNGKESAEQILNANRVNLVSEIVTELLGQHEIGLASDSNSPESKGILANTIAESIVSYVQSGAYYNKWNEWTAGWEISKQVRDAISPGSPVPIELVELIYEILKQL